MLILLLVFIENSQLNTHQVFVGLINSFWRVAAAYVIALIISLPLALLITVNDKVENLLLPIFDVLQSFPSFALFPVLVQALAGWPDIVIILVLVVTVIWPLLFSLISGIKNQREDLEEAATVFGAVGSKRFRHFTVPALMPSLITGSIVGWGEAWEFIIGAELLVHINSGIGSYLGQLGQTQQNQLLALGIVVLMLFLFIINKLIWLPLLHSSTKYQSEN